MALIKFRADQIFDGSNLLENHLLVTDEGGKILDLIPDNADKDAFYKDGILMPGMINAHLHLELSHLLGIIPVKTGLPAFVEAIMRNRLIDVDLQQDAMGRADEAMFAAGIQAAGDICNTADSRYVKSISKLTYLNFVEATGWNPAIAEQRLEHLKLVYDQLSNVGETSIVPHAPYSVSDRLWHGIQPFFRNKVVSMHNQETEDENQLFLKNDGSFRELYQRMNIPHDHFVPAGLTSIQTVAHSLEGAASVILVHNTFMNVEDMSFIKMCSQPVSLCICANANLYIEDKLPPIMDFVDQGMEICLGTDSLASNHQLSIAEELRTLSHYFPKLPLEVLLGWATKGGADALMLGDEFGRLRKGTKPGLIQLLPDFSVNRIF